MGFTNCSLLQRVSVTVLCTNTLFCSISVSLGILKFQRNKFSMKTWVWFSGYFVSFITSKISMKVWVWFSGYFVVYYVNILEMAFWSWMFFFFFKSFESWFGLLQPFQIMQPFQILALFSHQDYSVWG